jgi:integrase
VKTQDSIRTIPLVGCALAAMKLHPKGFPRYLDKGASFSAYVNGYLLDKGLRPTRKHTVYSLRHTFKDRLIAAKCQDSMIEALMGHSDDHPKYGSGPALDLKAEVLHGIAFKPPAVL